MIRLRSAVPEDAAGIARVHVRSWQAGYRGLIDQGILDALSIDDRASRWVSILQEPHPLTIDTIVATIADEVVGWVSFGAGRDEGTDSDGEVYGIYSDPSIWSRGAGYSLLNAAEASLVAARHQAAFLWVLDGNERADSFYARNGWAEDGATKVDERPEMTLREHRRIKHLR